MIRSAFESGPPGTRSFLLPECPWAAGQKGKNKQRNNQWLQGTEADG